MKPITVLIWSMPVWVCLVALYLVTRDVPNRVRPARVDAWGLLMQPAPKVLDAPRRVTPATPVTPVAPINAPDYWAFFDEWEQMQANSTRRRFDMWADWKKGSKFLLVGTVAEVDSTFGDCIVVVKRAGKAMMTKTSHESFVTGCAGVENLRRDEPIEATCTVVGKDYLGNPDLGDCEICWAYNRILRELRETESTE